MCLICVEYQKGNLTIAEARRNLGEMVDKVGEEHAQEVEDMLQEEEQDSSSCAMQTIATCEVSPADTSDTAGQDWNLSCP